MKLNIFQALKNQKIGTANGALGKLLDSFDAELSELIKNKSEEIKIGYRIHAFNNECNRIDEGIIATNSIAADYCSLLKGKKVSLDLLDEIDQLPSEKQKLPDALKKAYLSWNKINIPNFPVKIDKLIEVYDFSEDTLQLITNIVAKRESFLSSYKKYFDDKSGALVFTDEMRVNLKETFKRSISPEHIKNMFLHHLLCVSLSGLSRSLTDVSNDNQHYSYHKSLPEIDYRIMENLIIDRDPIPGPHSLLVNVNKFYNEMGCQLED